MHVNVAKEVAALEAMSMADLRGRYAQVFGEQTRVGNKTWLVRRIIWRMQARAEGDLSATRNQGVRLMLVIQRVEL
jgi:Protein of unknown function (DUF2924)